MKRIVSWSVPWFRKRRLIRREGCCCAWTPKRGRFATNHFIPEMAHFAVGMSHCTESSWTEPGGVEKTRQCRRGKTREIVEVTIAGVAGWIAAWQLQFQKRDEFHQKTRVLAGSSNEETMQWQWTALPEIAYASIIYRRCTAFFLDLCWWLWRTAGLAKSRRLYRLFVAFELYIALDTKPPHSRTKYNHSRIRKKAAHSLLLHEDPLSTSPLVYCHPLHSSILADHSRIASKCMEQL